MFESLLDEAYAVLDGEQMLVVAGIYWWDLTEAEVAAELTALRGRLYTRDRVHRIARTAVARLGRELVSIVERERVT